LKTDARVKGTRSNVWGALAVKELRKGWDDLLAEKGFCEDFDDMPRDVQLRYELGRRMAACYLSKVEDPPTHGLRAEAYQWKLGYEAMDRREEQFERLKAGLPARGTTFVNPESFAELASLESRLGIGQKIYPKKRRA